MPIVTILLYYAGIDTIIMEVLLEIYIIKNAHIIYSVYT